VQDGLAKYMSVCFVWPYLVYICEGSLSCSVLNEAMIFCQDHDFAASKDPGTVYKMSINKLNLLMIISFQQCRMGFAKYMSVCLGHIWYILYLLGLSLVQCHK
jgi:hypothetical protein